MNLILLEPREITDHGAARLAGTRAAHIIDVLKAGPGDRIRVGVIDGGTGQGRVVSVGNRTVDLRCEFDAPMPPRPAVDLLLALPRPKVMRRLWAQLAALGVGHIILTNAARVERNYFDTHVLEETCYRPLLIEGLQQARDTRLPIVSIHRQFKVLVEDHLDLLFANGLRIVADPAAVNPLSATIRDHAGERLLLAIGPEGGWTEFELKLLATRGFEAAAAGPRPLRSDTACIALVALAHDALNGV